MSFFRTSLIAVILAGFLAGAGSLANELPPAEYLKLRDPFRRPIGERGRQDVRSELEQGAVSDFKLVGVLTGPVRLRAMVQAPSGKTFFVSKNMKIGQRDGRIRRITVDSIVVREKVVNILGQEESVDSELFLNEKLKTMEGEAAGSGAVNGAPR